MDVKTEIDTKLMTADDVAAALYPLTRQTVIRMARRGEIPMFKTANRWHMNPETFDQWRLARDAGLTLGRSA